VTISSWLNFGHPAPPGRGSETGRNVWLRLTTRSAQCLRLLRALFSLPRNRCPAQRVAYTMLCITHLRCRITLRQKDPRWVGAWWVGYLAAAVIALLTAPFLFGYPPDPSTSTYWTRCLLSVVNQFHLYCNTALIFVSRWSDIRSSMGYFST